jgi:hypothetical protein
MGKKVKYKKNAVIMKFLLLCCKILPQVTKSRNEKNGIEKKWQ